MKLLSVDPGRKFNAGRQPFSLLFLRLSGPELDPVLHLMLHDAFEQDWIYVSRVTAPLECDSREAYYEAVFN